MVWAGMYSRGLHALGSVRKSKSDFALTNDLGIPFFAWPRTLLDYPSAGIDTGAFSLHCMETGEFLPYQRVAAKDNQHDRVLFFADLPAGTSRTFQWSTVPAAVNAQRVSVSLEANAHVIDTGAVKVRIPSTHAVSGEAPGPILARSRGEQWSGRSTLHLQGHVIRSITTEQIEAGPLRSIHHITYETAEGLKYRVRIRAHAGEPFIRMHEDMEDFPDDVHGEFRFVWTEIPFAFRQSPNHPYQFPSRPLDSYEHYPWESIAPVQMDSQFGVVPGMDAKGTMPFNLRIFEPWQDLAAASFANFSCADRSDAAGIFIDRLQDWNDHEYAIWRSSSKLAVDFEYHTPDLTFVWKLARGTRSSAVAFYDHDLDRQAMHVIEQACRGVMLDGQHFGVSTFPSSYGLYTQNWQGTLSLASVKDWSLRYT